MPISAIFTNFALSIFFNMINRVLIRVKVVQMLYSYQLTRPDRTFEQALQDLQASFEKSYDLYLYLIKLIP